MTYVNDDIRAEKPGKIPEIPVDLELIDMISSQYDSNRDTCWGEDIHVTQYGFAHTPGGYCLPLARKQIKIECGSDEATIAWLPVFVRSVRTTRVKSTPEEDAATEEALRRWRESQSGGETDRS